MKKFIIHTALFLAPLILLAIPLDYLLSEFTSRNTSISVVADEYSVWNDIFDGVYPAGGVRVYSRQ